MLPQNIFVLVQLIRGKTTVISSYLYNNTLAHSTVTNDDDDDVVFLNIHVMTHY